ncbi:MAG: FUSC family protein [Planctomycetota bacterium]
MSAPSQREETIFTLRQAFKLALSLVLFYAFALWTNWDVPRYGALAIVIVSLGTHGASLKQGLMRIAGTTAGVLIGGAVLSLFNDDRWATMLALATNMGLMCYCMQKSHYRYAWYAAGFIPLTVWADNYPQFDDAFYFPTTVSSQRNVEK